MAPSASRPPQRPSGAATGPSQLAPSPSQPTQKPFPTSSKSLLAFFAGSKAKAFVDSRQGIPVGYKTLPTKYAARQAGF